jgi:uncharacterized protein DUF4153
VTDPTPTPAPLSSSSPEPLAGLPASATPYLLVMPATEAGAAGSIAWPGPEGQPAWAIPVTIPAGTRGYAIFVPLQPVGEPGAGPAPVAVPVPAQAAVAEAAAAGGPVADAKAADAPAVEAPSVDGPANEPAARAVEAIRPANLSAASEAAPSEAAAPTNTPTATPTAAPTSSTPKRIEWEPASIPRPGSTAYGRPPTYAGPVFESQFLRDKWPGPERARGWRVPAAVALGGLGAAIFTPLGHTGIGWFLAGLSVAAAVVVTVRRAVAAEPAADRWMRLAWTVAALALLAVPAFRNAWWLVAFCVLGALACAALGIIGGRQVRSMLFSQAAAAFAAFRGIPWVARHLEIRGRDGAPVGVVRRVVVSVLVTGLVLLVFGTLLASADAAFARILSDGAPSMDAVGAFRWIFLLVFGALTVVAAAYTLSAPPNLSQMDAAGDRKLGLLEWALPIGGLVLLFAGFVEVQFTVLFGGQRHVLDTAGLSYADYARSGFWQLFAVTLLTLAVLGGVTRWARRESNTERVVLRVLLGLLCALSVVIVISALYRMNTYQQVYSFTGERVFVMAFEILLGTIFLMIMAAGIRWRGAWIPRLTAGLAVVMLLSLAVLNPEDYVARLNIERYQQIGKIDAWYLRALSADATPALTQLPDAVRRCTLSWIASDLAKPDPWYAWNLGRARARAALDKLGPNAIGGPRDCQAADQFDFRKTP